MKSTLTIFAFLAFSLGAMAQQNNDDQLQQQAPRETQVEVERAATRDAQKIESEKIRAEAEQKAAKQKAEDQKAAELKKNELNKTKSKAKSKMK